MIRASRVVERNASGATLAAPAAVANWIIVFEQREAKAMRQRAKNRITMKCSYKIPHCAYSSGTNQCLGFVDPEMI
jgi:hypothetical protein